MSSISSIELGAEHHDRGALRRGVGQHAVDVAFGARVDAARRVVEEQDPRIHREPAGDDDLLLVAAAERGDRVRPVAGDDLQRLDVALEAPLRRRAAHEPAAAILLDGRHLEVLEDRARLEDRLRPPIARDVGDAARQRVPRRAHLALLPADRADDRALERRASRPARAGTGPGRGLRGPPRRPARPRGSRRRSARRPRAGGRRRRGRPERRPRPSRRRCASRRARPRHRSSARRARAVSPRRGAAWRRCDPSAGR